jgi:hypothetical protein
MELHNLNHYSMKDMLCDSDVNLYVVIRKLLDCLHLTGIHTLVDNSNIRVWVNAPLTRWQRGCVNGEGVEGCPAQFIAETDQFLIK